MNRRDFPHMRSATQYDMDGAVGEFHQDTTRLPLRERTFRAIATLSLGASLVAGGSVFRDVATGITEGKMEVADDRSQVHVVYDNYQHNKLSSRHGTFVLTGLGTKNPTETAASLTQHQAIGSVYAIEYSNNDLDTDVLAQNVIEQAQADGLQYVSFDGYSAGGPIALAIAAYIHTHEQDMYVAAVTMNSSPLGQGSLTEKSELSMETMNRILDVYPDFVYYKRGRYAIELIARSERYLDDSGDPERFADGVGVTVGDTDYTFSPEHFRYDVFDVRSKLNNPNTASADLMRHQVDFIVTTNYEDNIYTLLLPKDDDINAIPPVITYTHSEHPGDDTVVDVVQSRHNFEEVMQRYRQPQHVYAAPVGHANPTERPAEYQELIASSIQPLVRSQLETYEQPVYGPHYRVVSSPQRYSN